MHQRIVFGERIMPNSGATPSRWREQCSWYNYSSEFICAIWRRRLDCLRLQQRWILT